ncbi:hypothetical protein KB20921_02230 [Edwardsiella ictaluri]|nr:hypothetical protein KH20906_02240 [Edwardsiella ictaluri]BEI00962.1 hypothetical protein KB20921_02230 [Edwardsiella ictaluri]BEI04438.1 hypothetical protein KH201010_02240 [Edwardsiella ictaluri]BEI07892.1 hypothetical protein STU22726_02230 [Edwardsiella ictaluri]BEI11370.1 hypothetical protein STU22816_02230 [Edwardsiella ictaluri]
MVLNLQGKYWTEGGNRDRLLPPWNTDGQRDGGSFNGRLRQACLNENGFISLEDARCKIETCRIHDNQRHPHCAPGWMTPSEFAEKSAGCQNMQPE